MSEIAPSAHHRFDKDSVHLRTTYRKLYPGEGPRTNRSLLPGNGTASPDSTGRDFFDLQARSSLHGTNNQLNQRAFDSMGFVSSGNRRDNLSLTNHRGTFGLTGMSSTQGGTRTPQGSVFRMNTTSLLQNTPLSVDLHKNEHLVRTRELPGFSMNAPGAISPPIGMINHLEGNMSATQSRFYANAQNST